MNDVRRMTAWKWHHGMAGNRHEMNWHVTGYSAVLGVLQRLYHSQKYVFLSL